MVDPLEYHFLHRASENALLESIRNFFLLVVWLPLNFRHFGLSRGRILSVQ